MYLSPLNKLAQSVKSKPKYLDLFVLRGA